MQKYWKKISIALVIAIVFGATGFYYWKNSGSFINSASAYNLNQKIRFGQDLHFDFPEEMNRKSVEENLILPSNFEAEFTWTDNRNLTLKPKNPTEKGELYYFTLQRSTQKLDGTYLGEDLVYRFEIAGAPTLVSRLPAPDSTGISANSNITLIFDRPVAPLSAVQGENSTFDPTGWNVQISPSIAGRWRWVGTTSVKFEPSDKLQLATKYEVKIPAGISVQNNDQTDEDFSFSFETERPQVVSTDPYSGSDSVGPNPEIHLTFNQKIDLNDLKSKTILKSEKQDYKPKSAKYYQYESTYVDTDGKEKTETITDELTAVLTFDTLPLDTDFELTLAKDLRGTEGNLGLEEDYVLNFSTVGKFAVTNAEFYGSLDIYFSNPLPSGDLKQYFKIEPAITGWDEVSVEPNYWSDEEVTIYANFNPSTDYTLTVDKKLADNFGQNLSENYVFHFTVPELDPQVSIYSKEDFSVFEKAQSKPFYINALNVSQVEIDFAKLSLEEFVAFQNERNSDYDFVPDLANRTNYQHFTLTNDSPKNQWKIFAFDPFAHLSSYPQSGIYVLTVRAPEWRDQYERTPYTLQQYFAVTNTALTLKYSGADALVWATDMQTGKSIANADITFFNANSDKILSGKTDLDGFCEIKNFEQSKFQIYEYDTWNPQFWVTAQTGDDFAFISSNWNNGLNPWNFGMNSDFRSADARQYRVDGYIYTDRPIYRAGDTVQVKAIVRLRDKLGQLSVPANREAQVTVRDPDYNEVFSQKIKLNAFGSLNFEYPSTSDAMLGNYDVNVTLLPEEQYDWNYAGGSFKILAYKKPEYKVSVTFPQTDYYQGDTLQAEVVGEYYFGAPMSDADVTWRVQSTDYFFNRYTGDDWYSFSLESNWCWWNCSRSSEIIATGNAKLDSSGKLALKLPIDISDKALSQVLTVEAEVTDSNNQSVASSDSVIAHKSNVYVGIMPEQYIATPDTPARIKLITLNPQGEAIANQKISLTLFERTWNSIRKKNVDGEYYYENEPTDTEIKQYEAKTNDKGEATAEVNLPKGGNYRVLAKVRDSQGRESVADTTIYAWSNAYVNFAQPNSDKIEIVADKQEYKVGDTATLMVKSPYQGQGVKMLLTLERENILERQVIDLSANAQPIKFQITEDMIPNVFASAMIIKPRQGQTFDENGLDTGAPIFKMGYTKLNVATETKQLQVSIQTDAKQYAPRAEVTANLLVTDSEGNPVQAEVSLATVDMSVLALTGFNLPDLVARFYTEHGLGVLTSQSLLYIADYFKPGTKGGGGGEPTSADARQNFKDTAYWNPTILTDKDGKAQVKFTLPDNLTTWKLIAIAHDKSSDFGAKAEEVIETKDVILRSVKPRFALVNDEIQLGAIVHNFTNDDRNFEIKLTGTGFKTLDTDTISVNVKPDQQTKVIFPVKITDLGEVAFDLKATSGTYSDHIFEKIPTYHFDTPQVVATAGQTTDRVHESVYTPASAEITEGNITIKTSATLATYLADGLDYLINYPYGCAEQTASAVLANWIAGQFSEIKLLNLDQTEIQDNITTGLAKIYDLQRWDGGFGYWSGSSESNPYLTAYILSVLNQVDNSDKEVRGRAYNYLDAVLRSKDPNIQLSNVSKIYILYTMSEFGKIDTSFLVNIYDEYDDLPLFAKAELAMIYQNSGNATRAKEILTDVTNSAQVDARGIHFEEPGMNDYRYYMQDNVRTTAEIMQATLQINPTSELLPNITRWLLNSRQDGVWNTTQTTASVLVTIRDYMDQTKELNADFQAEVSVADAPSLSAKFNSDNLLSIQEANINLADLEQTQLIGIDLEKSGSGVLYYDLLMSYLYTADEIAPTEQGLGIQSEVLPVGNSDPNNLQVGQNYKIKLTMTVPEDRYFVGVESMLPAGFEPINLDFQTTVQVDLGNEIDNYNWYFNHTEMRDDRVFLFADYLPAGVYEYEYLVRATTPGKFLQRPSRIWEMYTPENFGQTWGGWIEIKD